MVGVASIAGTMFANVTERRREIGTLMALGATPSLVSRLFLGKALVIGLAGGVLGYVGGTVLAVGAGPYWAGIAVRPVPSLAVVALVLAGGGGARCQLSAGAAGGAHRSVSLFS